MARKRAVIMGAAGRDFHNFNVRFRHDADYEVVAFTAAQIPGIEGKTYPPALAGDLYPQGIPIVAEEHLTDLIRDHQVDVVVFAYSDVTHEYVMHRASRVLSAGADFWLLGPNSTTLRSTRKVVSVCAVRTGCGKSQTSRKIARILKSRGCAVVAVRHAMPYGNLERQKAQRFASIQDLQRQECTIEEMEEYEPFIELGIPVFAGVDYETLLRQAEKEAEIILWDGGNNDLPFFHSDLEIVVADPHRPGHELLYHPGETNLLRAHVVVINKIDTAAPSDVERVRDNIRRHNPKAIVVEAESPVTVEAATAITGRRVLVVEDGPTLTHGGMAFGAGTVAARQFGAREIVDPRPWLQGSLIAVFAQYPHIGNLLPAMGYGVEQMRDLERTLNAVDCDLVIVGTPIDLSRVIPISKPCVRARYELREIGVPNLETVVDDFLKKI
jgi:predicted GTPase